MVVIVKLDTGESYRLDRRYGVDQVAAIVEADRVKGKLTAFDSDNTPSRKIYIDPDHVVTVVSDGHPY